MPRANLQLWQGSCGHDLWQAWVWGVSREVGVRGVIWGLGTLWPWW